MTEIIIPKGCIEGPLDERNWQYDEVFGSSAVPDRFSVDDNQFQNQQSEGYPYGCVFFATSMGSNAMNFVEGGSVRNTWNKLCDYAEGIGKFNPSIGAYIIDWPKVGMELGYLAGMAEIRTIAQIEHSIANWRIVIAGSSRIDWRRTIENNYIIVWGESYGHCIHIVAYDRVSRLFKIKDSYGVRERLGGYMYLKYEDIWLLFTNKYSMIDSVDEVISYKEKVIKEINIEAAKTAFLNGIWNGMDATKPASREEVAAMVQRALDSMK